MFPGDPQLYSGSNAMRLSEAEELFVISFVWLFSIMMLPIVISFASIEMSSVAGVERDKETEERGTSRRISGETWSGSGLFDLWDSGSVSSMRSIGEEEDIVGGTGTGDKREM